ncbi:hypothetical protein ACLOJK_004111 [Asimina triloba]
MFFFFLAVFLLPPCQADLSLNYYQQTCPKLEDIVQRVMIDKQISNPTTAAGTVRLFFHDCFVSGCDASTLITSNNFNRAERDADINLSLPGDAFDGVVRAKTAVELACPGVVSCADILALVTRDLITMVGGPFYKVLFGRKDSLTSKASAVDGNLPLPSMSMNQIIRLFKSKGFSVREMVALTGAHTIGFTHCSEFASRIYNYGGKPGAVDPTMNPKFVEALKKACATYEKVPSMSVFNDIMTPGKFDNLYFQNLPKGLGLLTSDSGIASDSRTKPYVEMYAANQTAFFSDFVQAMEKLSIHDVTTAEDKGEVRRRCDQFNSLLA